MNQQLEQGQVTHVMEIIKQLRVQEVKLQEVKLQELKLCEQERRHLGEDMKVGMVEMKREMEVVKETVSHSVVNPAKDTEEST